MFPLVKWVFSFILLVFWQWTLAVPIMLVDASGHAVQLAKPATRIISLAPDITEMLYAIGAGPKLIAISDDSDYPAVAKHLPVVGGYQQINIEAILALHPDLVLAWSGNPQGALESLKQFGIPVYLINDQHLLDIPKTMQNLGQLLGVETQANQAAAAFLQQYQQLLSQAKRHKPVSVFLEVSNAPLYTLSSKTLQNEVLSLCGGENIFATLPGYAAEVSVESVLAANPHVIIGLSPVDLSYWQQWPQLQAVKSHRVYTLDADLLARASPRILQGAAQICQWLQP
jgi:iron complex transport system substrate-binding protein